MKIWFLSFLFVPIFALADSQRVLIIGGGISGVVALFNLRNQPDLKVTLVEKENRMGGRVHTYSQVREHQGLRRERAAELINSDDIYLMGFIADLNRVLKESGRDEIKLVPSNINEDRKENVFRFGGRSMNKLKFDEALFSEDGEQIKKYFRHLHDRGYRDQLVRERLKISEYLEREYKNGLFKRFIQGFLKSENGEQGYAELPVEILFMYLDVDLQNKKILPIPESDEMYRVEGGNQRLADSVFDLYSEKIKLSTVVREVNRRFDGAFDVIFETPSGLQTQTFDLIDFTLPDAGLKIIKSNDPQLQARFQKGSESLYGGNGKIFFQISLSPEELAQLPPQGMSELGFQYWVSKVSKDFSSGEERDFVLFTVFTGTLPEAKVEREKRLREIRRELVAIAPVLEHHLNRPDISSFENSYSVAYSPQEMILGRDWFRSRAIHNIFFSGEAWAEKFGYIEGAAETGTLTVRRILSQIQFGANSCRMIYMR